MRDPKPLKIGFDVDGVLADFNENFVKLVIKVTGRNLFPAWPFDIPTWNYPEYYGYTKAETTAVWNEIKRDAFFWQGLHEYPGNSQVMAQVNEEERAHGSEIYFVTNRMGVEVKAQTERWLSSRLSSYYGNGSPTVLISGHKGLVCRALELDVYIDDKWENCLDVAQTCLNTQAFLLSRPWNVGVSAENYRVLRIDAVNKFIPFVRGVRESGQSFCQEAA